MRIDIKRLLLTLIVLFSFGFTQEEYVKKAFKEGMGKYMQGDIYGAIKSIEFANKEAPSYKKAKNALIIIYPVYIKKMYEAKNYATTKEYCNKLLKLKKRHPVALEYLKKPEFAKKNSSLIKDFQKDKKEKVELVKKSSLEKELEEKHEEAKTTGAYVPSEDTKQLKEEQNKRVQQVIIQTKSTESADSAALDSFIETLKELKKSEDSSLDKILALTREQKEREDKLRREGDKKDFKNKLVIWILIGVVAIVLGWVAWFIIKVMQRRAHMAESHYRFTAERENKILEVMNNVVNLDKRADASFQIGQDKPAAGQLADNSQTQTVVDSNVVDAEVVETVDPNQPVADAQSTVVNDGESTNAPQNNVPPSELPATETGPTETEQNTNTNGSEDVDDENKN